MSLVPPSLLVLSPAQPAIPAACPAVRLTWRPRAPSAPPSAPQARRRASPRRGGWAVQQEHKGGSSATWWQVRLPLLEPRPPSPEPPSCAVSRRETHLATDGSSSSSSSSRSSSLGRSSRGALGTGELFRPRLPGLQTNKTDTATPSLGPVTRRQGALLRGLSVDLPERAPGRRGASVVLLLLQGRGPCVLHVALLSLILWPPLSYPRSSHEFTH